MKESLTFQFQKSFIRAIAYSLEQWTKFRFNEPRFTEVVHVTNNILQPSQCHSNMYDTEPRYSNFLVLTNIIRKHERKIYLDITY